jgi:ribosomal protein S18 acetylase RimI-like enzyme
MTKENRPLADVEIVPYEHRHAVAFRDLNLDWIQEYFTVEEIDRKHLFSPVEEILVPGGAIFMAEQGGVAVGCCALLNHGGGVFEVSKMAIDRRTRGGGIGRKLLSEVIRRSPSIGATKLTIISNTVLAPAIHLYRELGFREVPLRNEAYARGNIALEMLLRTENRHD